MLLDDPRRREAARGGRLGASLPTRRSGATDVLGHDLSVSFLTDRRIRSTETAENREISKKNREAIKHEPGNR
jgi:hypothetical protein